MDEDAISEFRSLVAGAQALVQWESELGGAGFPAAVPERAQPADPGGRSARRSGPSLSAEPDRSAARADRVALDAPRERVPLSVVAERAAACTGCDLHQGRTRSVFSRGSEGAEIMLIGEGPGYNEDQQGAPFVGAAGQLLDRMIAAMGYGQDDVYICNVVKCRPPENRTPTPAEAAACEPYLVAQIEAVQPKVIVALGKCATENLGCMPEHERRWRGVFREYRGIPVMPTYHPAFLLRSPQFKRPVWDDLKSVLAKLGRRPPGG